ncbi:hypothetical protein ACHQM5_015733 [Ranunculus cassubicifolius]
MAPPPIIPVKLGATEALFISKDLVAEGIKGFPKGTSCGRDGLRAQHLLDCLGGAASVLASDLLEGITSVCNLFLQGRCPSVLGEFVASAPLTPLLKPGGGIRPIAVGTIWRRLVSKMAAKIVGQEVGPYLEGNQFGVGVPGGCEAILHSVNRLMEEKGQCGSYTMLLVDFRNAFNLVDRNVMLEEVQKKCPMLTPWVEFCYAQPGRLYYEDEILWSSIGVQQGDPLGPLLFALVLHPLILKVVEECDLLLNAWYLDDGTIIGDTSEVAKALNIISKEGPKSGLHLNIDKTEVFWPKEDSRSRMEGLFPTNIVRPVGGVKLLGGAVSTDKDFREGLALKRVEKAISLMSAISKLDNPQCELLLLRSCAGVAKLSYALRTCDPDAFSAAQVRFDSALRCSLERIVTNEGSGFGEWQYRLATFPIRRGGLGVISAADVMNYAFIASRLQSKELQGKILANAGINHSSMGSSFSKALASYAQVCTVVPDTVSISVPNAMHALADRYFSCVEKELVTLFELDVRQQTIWECSKEDKAQDFLYAIPIEGLGNSMDARQFRASLCYRMGVPLFQEGGYCPSCHKKVMDKYGDHAVACGSEIGYKYRHNLVRDTLFDIMGRAGIGVQKEAPLGFLSTDGRVGLRPADILVYGWDRGKNVCIDVTGVSPLVGSEKGGFRHGIALDMAVKKKHIKHSEVCSKNGYGFLAFGFTTFGGVGTETLELVRRIGKVLEGHTLGKGYSKYLWPRLSFCIQRGVSAQLVSRLPINFL